jgi:hypothetical protein
MWRTIRGCLLVGCVLLAALSNASGQEGAAAAEKRAAIKKLIEVENVAQSGNYLYARVVGRFQQPSADSLIAGMKERGFFKPLSAEEGAELERRLRVYEGEVFAESIKAVTEQIGTAENHARVAAEVFDKYLTLDEINRIIAFDQSPLGRKLNRLIPELLADSAVARLEAKGVYDLPSVESSDEMWAKLRQFREELTDDKEFLEILRGAASGLRSRLSEDDYKELLAFYETPFGRRFREVYPRLHGEMTQRFYALYGQQAGAIWSKVSERKLRDYMVWLSEATRPGARLGAPKPLPQNKSLDITIGPPDKKPGRP